MKPSEKFVNDLVNTIISPFISNNNRVQSMVLNEMYLVDEDLYFCWCWLFFYLFVIRTIIYLVLRYKSLLFVFLTVFLFMFYFFFFFLLSEIPHQVKQS